MQSLLDFWNGLSATQKTIAIVGGVAILLFMLWSFVFAGADYSGFGDWLAGLFGR